MSSSATHTTSNLARFRSMIEQWEASQPPPQGFPTNFDQQIQGASLKPTLRHGTERDGKDVVVAFRTRPPLEGEAKEKFITNLDFLVKDAKDSTNTDDGDLKTDDVEFCPGFNIRSAEPGVMVVHVPGMKWSGPTITPKSYESDLAFSPDIGNDEAYARTVDAHDMINLVLGGGVGCVLAYGQTGSGKTYTMEALEQRIARDIFPAAEVLSARFLATHNTHGGQNTTEPNTIGTTKSIFKITVTFLELLGKKATDLLAVARMENDDTQDESVSDEAPKEVPIIENKLGEVRPPLLEPTVTSPEELNALITQALSYRRTSATARNARSSRSHAVLTLRVKNTLVPYADEGVLLLVDLAGSERYEDSKLHDKQRMDESRENNKALMNLKECVRAKARSAVQEESFVHIPYRANKLTMLLKPIFDLESRQLSKTLIIAHVSPFLQDAAHSANTLSYASPFKSTPPRPSGPAVYDASDPRTWDNDKTREWVQATFQAAANRKNKSFRVDVEKIVLPGMTARNVARMYANEWFERCIEGVELVSGTKAGVSTSKDLKERDLETVKTLAMDVYGKFHYMLMRAKTRTRKEVMKSRKGLAVKDVYGNKPWESDVATDEPSTSDTPTKPPVSTETAINDTDWMVLVTLHYEEVTEFIENAMNRARENGDEVYEAKEAAIMEMWDKYREEIEAEKRKVEEEEERKKEEAMYK